VKNPIKMGLILARGARAVVDLVRSPTRLDRVYDVVQVQAALYPSGLTRIHEIFVSSPQGAAAIREKRRIRVDLNYLCSLPPGTLGRVYGDHMRANGLDPDELPDNGDRASKASNLPFAEDILFIRAHIYDTHDVWHVVTGFGTDIAGELGLQAFVGAQYPYALPAFLLGIGFLNAAMFGTGDLTRRLDAISRGWEIGRRARPLFGVRWDEMWTRPLDEVRRALEVEPYEENRASAEFLVA
jgi:ubiquinone biosynthesis protein Coq4